MSWRKRDEGATQGRSRQNAEPSRAGCSLRGPGEGILANDQMLSEEGRTSLSHMIQITIPNDSHIQPCHIQILFELSKIGIGQYDARAKNLVGQNRSEGTKKTRQKSGAKGEREKVYRGTCEYASIICSEVAWKSKSRPVVPAASRLIAARTLQKAGLRVGAGAMPSSERRT